MNDDQIVNQDAESADEAQKTLTNGEQSNSGNALLDAQIESSNRSMDDPPGGNPIATNLNEDADLDDPNNTVLFTTPEADSSQQEDLKQD